MIMALVAVVAVVAIAAVQESDLDAINREPAVEKLTAEEERLIPYIDGSGALNGAISEKIQLPSDDLASVAPEPDRAIATPD